jgi:hypothetical protein
MVNKDKLEQENRKLLDKAKEIEDYKLEIKKTKINNDYELDSKEQSIIESEIAVTEAEKTLRNLLDDTSNQELIFIQNEVKQAKISLENENKKLETYELKAPFD